jgi:AAA domain
MVRLTRLQIDRFRNVKPGTVLDFGPTFNVLLGKNATGKTTLLDLIAAVTNDDLSAYAKEDAGFDLTWWLDTGTHQLEVRAERMPASTKEPGQEERQEKDFDDSLTVALTGTGLGAGRVVVKGMHGRWEPRDAPPVQFDAKFNLVGVRPTDRVVWALLSADVKAAVVSAAHIKLRNVYGRVGRFDEALLALNAMTQADLEVRRGSRWVRSSSSPWLPSGFRQATAQLTAPDPLVIHLEDLGALSPVLVALGFASAELRPRMLTRSQDGEEVTTTYRGFDCYFRRTDGSQLSYELLSFGQKRLFSFLWYLAAREELPVVADELLNGLHHEWIEICLERLRERQSFLATQHPYLLDHIPIESAAGVRTTFLRCTLEPGPDGREQLVWRNFNEEEAERFFTAYQTGIPQVSEVLMMEGLW